MLNNGKKGTAIILSALLMLLMLIPSVAASSIISNGNGAQSDYTLTAIALKEATGSNLYLTVAASHAGGTAPETIKKLQITTYDDTGKHISTRNEKDLPSPGGKLTLDLQDVSLGFKISVQALVQTAESVNTEALNADTAVTELAVNADQVVVSNFQGYGAQMNMHLYTALNDPARGFVGNEPPKEVANVEAKVKDMKPGLTRIFLSPVNYDPGNENRMESFIQTVELAQEAGATVNVTWWFIERAPGDNPVRQEELMQENMRQFADTLIDLVHNRGLTAVQEITIQNEVNTTWVKPALYEHYYRLLDSHLRDAGIRDQIRFVGGDLVFNNQLIWFTHMADYMGDVLDGWSVHIYWNYWDTAYMLKRLADINTIYQNIAPEKRKPMSITEYGVRGIKLNNNNPQDPIKNPNPYRGGQLTNIDPGIYQDGTVIAETNILAFQHAWFNMLAVNQGFTGMSKWDAYRAQYDFTYQNYSLIGYRFNPEPGEDRWPLRPAYYMQWLMGNTTGKDWKVLGNSGTAGAKLITPFRSPSGDWTVFALNRDSAPASFSIGGLPANTAFQVLIWNSNGEGKVTKGSTVNSGATGSVTVDAPAGSFLVLTTVSANPPL
jgi:hypothetical protein